MVTQEQFKEIQSLRRLHYTKLQVSGRLNLAYNTVAKYWNMSLEEFESRIEIYRQNRKKYDFSPIRESIEALIKMNNDISARAIFTQLSLQQIEIPQSSFSTFRNYVRNVKAELGIQPKWKRNYTAVPECPPGFQAQVDFGEKWIPLKDDPKKKVKVYFMVMLLANSRFKWVGFRDHSLKTEDIIAMHKEAFAALGGVPQEIWYDNDKRLVSSVNNGEIIRTKLFDQFMREMPYKDNYCKPRDPESKGKVENAVGYVKKNFLAGYVFEGIEKLNEDAQIWLKTIANAKEHATTKKIPAEMFPKEREHLIPVLINDNRIISKKIEKDNTVHYSGNRYALSPGTFNKLKEVQLRVTDELLTIIDLRTGEILEIYEISSNSGELVTHYPSIEEERYRQNYHYEYSETLDQNGFLDVEYIRNYAKFLKVSTTTHNLQIELFPILGLNREVADFIMRLKFGFPRYIREQLTDIKKTLENSQNLNPEMIMEAINVCRSEGSCSASAFKKALTSRIDNSSEVVSSQADTIPEKTLESDPQTTKNQDTITKIGNLFGKVQKTDLSVYGSFLNPKKDES